MIVLFTKYLAPNAQELRTVKVAYVGGAPLDNALVTRLSALIPNAVIGQMYGMTEGGAMTGPSLDTKIPALSAPESGIRSASVGKMFPGNEWKVIKIDGSLARRGEKGELWVRTPTMASGYRNNVDASSDTFVDGWLRTGDEVFFDQNDEMFHVQRLKDFMKVKGFRVNPIEIEGHLLEYPDILDCCVVPVPDEFSYELPKAFVVLTQEARDKLPVARSGSNDGQAAENALKDKLIQAHHKIAYKHLAGGVESCDEIPKTSSGKLLRRVLRDRPTDKVPT